MIIFRKFLKIPNEILGINSLQGSTIKKKLMKIADGFSLIHFMPLNPFYTS